MVVVVRVGWMAVVNGGELEVTLEDNDTLDVVDGPAVLENCLELRSVAVVYLARPSLGVILTCHSSQNLVDILHRSTHLWIHKSYIENSRTQMWIPDT